MITQEEKVDQVRSVTLDCQWGTGERLLRILSRATLRDFWEQPNYADSEQPLTAWYDEAKHANWQTPQDIKALYRNASFVGNNRVVFNIHGNKYQLITAINYKFSMVYIRFIGTHADYDKVDAKTV